MRLSQNAALARTAGDRTCAVAPCELSEVAQFCETAAELPVSVDLAIGDLSIDCAVEVGVASGDLTYPVDLVLPVGLVGESRLPCVPSSNCCTRSSLSSNKELKAARFLGSFLDPSLFDPSHVGSVDAPGSIDGCLRNFSRTVLGMSLPVKLYTWK